MTEDEFIAAAVEAMTVKGAVFVVRERPDGNLQVTVLGRKFDIQAATDAIVEAVELSDGVPSPYAVDNS